MLFVADDLGAWLVGLLADAGHNKLTAWVLGTDQERALRSAATAAVRLTAEELRPDNDGQAEQVALVISQFFREPVPAVRLAGNKTMLEALQAAIAEQLAVLEDASFTGTGQSSADVPDTPGAVVAERLTANLLREIVTRGAHGGPLFPLASQLNDDLTHLQRRRFGNTVTSLAGDVQEALDRLDRRRARKASEVTARPNEVAGHVFISYIREDSRHVDLLQQALEEAGVQVWRDTRDLWPGEDWRLKIRRAITDNALVFIACFSSRSLARSRSYQNEELLLAIEQLRLRSPEDPWLIPVRFDECEIPERDIGGGRTLTSIQRADLFDDHLDEGVTRVLTTVLRILGRLGNKEASAWQSHSEDGRAVLIMPSRDVERTDTEDAGADPLMRNRTFAGRTEHVAPDPARTEAERQKAVGAAPHNDPEAAGIYQARAIRVLTDAERIAQSFNDEGQKARLLAHIAKALAAIDPDRAARLITEAERAAESIASVQSIVEPWKARALADIARALAATDPVRAERIAWSIINEAEGPYALADIARALAATDPDRAERIARSVAERSWKADALADIAKAVAATDPDRAARLITDAERIAQSLIGKRFRAEHFAHIAKALAATDPDRAERIARSLINGGPKVDALADIAKAVAATDPDRAARLITDAERIAQSLTKSIRQALINQSPKADALADIAKAVAATNPDRAERIAKSITDTYPRASAFADIAETLAASDPDRAAWLIDEAEDIAQSITDESWKAIVRTNIAKAVAATDPDRAERIAKSITNEFSKAWALVAITEVKVV